VWLIFLQEKIATRLDLHGLELIPIYVSIAQTYSDLRRYKDAITYYQKELALRLGEPEQVIDDTLILACF
jgi:Tetratricopeptide repeat